MAAIHPQSLRYKGVGGQHHAPPLYPWEQPIEAGLAWGPFWTGTENLAPHRGPNPGPSSP